MTKEEKIKKRKDKIKKLITKWQFWVIIFVVLLIIVPFCIHIAFKFEGIAFWSAEWTAGELLGFWGSVLAFIGSMVLGMVAVWQNKKQREDESQKCVISQMPRLFSEYQELVIDDYAKKENLIDVIYIEIGEDHNISTLYSGGNIRSDIDKYHKNYLEYQELETKKQILSKSDSKFEEILDELIKKCNVTTELLNAIKKTYLFSSYKLTNYGESSLNINMTINNQKAIPLFALNRSESKTIYFLLNFPFNKTDFEFKEILFEIILQQTSVGFLYYEQKDYFSIYRDINFQPASIINKQMSKPYQIEEYKIYEERNNK